MESGQNQEVDMSKPKTTKATTRTKARTGAKGKKVAQAAQAKTTEAQNAPVAPTRAKGTRPREELVVFAFRLSPQERDLIHQAAGPAKASRFVRALTVAASRGDAKAVGDIVQAVQGSSS